FCHTRPHVDRSAVILSAVSPSLTSVFLNVTDDDQRSTLFPYTTLFRSGRGALRADEVGLDRQVVHHVLAELGQFVKDKRGAGQQDRKSTRLNSSHVASSYAVFCLKKKETCSFDLLVGEDRRRRARMERR